MNRRSETMPKASELQVGNCRQRRDAESPTEPHECEHRPTDSSIAVGRHWISLTIFYLLSTALCLRCLSAPPPWSVQVSTNPAGPWITVTNVTWPAGFARLQGPAGTGVTVGNALTISNATAVLSNGTLSVTAGITSNSLNQIAAMIATNLPLNLNLVGQ